MKQFAIMTFVSLCYIALLGCSNSQPNETRPSIEMDAHALQTILNVAYKAIDEQEGNAPDRYTVRLVVPIENNPGAYIVVLDHFGMYQGDVLLIDSKGHYTSSPFLLGQAEQVNKIEVTEATEQKMTYLLTATTSRGNDVKRFILTIQNQMLDIEQAKGFKVEILDPVQVK